MNSSQKKNIKYLILFFLFSIFLGLYKGSYDISIFDFLFGKTKEIEEFILLKIRVPRVILAGLVGASLALSGSCLQGLFRNPLADPGLIGVSSGAALGAAISIVIGSELIANDFFKLYFLPFCAIVGSILAIIILSILTKGFKNSNITYIILAGIAINALAGVGIGVLTYLSDDSELRGLTFWTMGSFEGMNWSIITPSCLIIIITTIWTTRFAKKLDILQLGEHEALRIGVDVKKLKINIIISSAIVVGISTSLVGIIGFVGLVVPHLVRIIGGANHNYVIIGSIFSGATLLILADMIARIIIQPAQLPVGLITSAIGAPFFLWLIYNMKKT